jgi:large subunit ribosomal protein L25
MNRTVGTIEVAVEARTERGKNASRRLRARGLVPATLYGLNRDPFAVAVDPRRVEEILRLSSGRNTIFNLTLAGGQQSRAVMLRELQRDPLTEKLVHVDFLRVDPTRRIHVKVPVRLLGTPEGVKNEGGVLEFVHREVEVACLPSAIPEHLDVDVTELHNNQHVSVKDLQGLEDVEIIDDPEAILAVVAAPRIEVPEAPPEAVEAAVAEGAEAKPAEGEAKGGGAE